MFFLIFIRCSKTVQNGVKITLETLGSYSSQFKLEYAILSRDQVLSSYIRGNQLAEVSGSSVQPQPLCSHTPEPGVCVRSSQFTQR